MRQIEWRFILQSALTDENLYFSPREQILFFSYKAKIILIGSLRLKNVLSR